MLSIFFLNLVLKVNLIYIVSQLEPQHCSFLLLLFYWLLLLFFSFLLAIVFVIVIVIPQQPCYC